MKKTFLSTLIFITAFAAFSQSRLSKEPHSSDVISIFFENENYVNVQQTISQKSTQQKTSDSKSQKNKNSNKKNSKTQNSNSQSFSKNNSEEIQLNEEQNQISKKNFDNFFTLGKDGYIVKWNLNLDGEHFQLTKNKILRAAQNPARAEFAIYESDENAFNAISVWDYSTLTKKYSVNFNDTILSMTYSKKGTYLIIGTSTERGLLFLNTKTGKFENPISEKLNMISYAESANSEKSILTYSIVGNIFYHDLQNGKLKAKIKTQSGVENVLSFAKNRYLAGTKDNALIVLDAMSGETKFTLKSPNSRLFTKNDELFYFVQSTNLKGAIYKIEILDSDSSSTEKKFKSILYKNIFLSNSDKIASIFFNEQFMIFGGTSGNLYFQKSENNFEDSTLQNVELSKFTEIDFTEIIDVCYVNDDLYLLTKNSIFKTNEEKSDIVKIADNKNYKNLVAVKNMLILWSQEENVPVSVLNSESGDIQELFSVNGQIMSVKSSSKNFIFIENNSSIKYFDFEKNQLTEIYYGSGIQDAVLINDTDLYIAKSKSSVADTGLLFVNIKTKETVPLTLPCDFIYALSADKNNYLTDSIYAIGINNKNKKAETLILRFDTKSKSFKTVKTYSAIDYNAFIKIYNDAIYTNILSQDFYSINKGKELHFAKNTSFPYRLVMNYDNVVILNQDKSLSWYDLDSDKSIADWFLTLDEVMIEY